MIYLSFSIILLYIVWSFISKGIPHSLSETYYNNNFGFCFSLFFSTATIFPKLMQITPNNIQFILFLAVAGILFIIVAPDYKSNKFVDKVHTFSALITLIFSQIWVSLICPLCLFWWILLIVYGIINFNKNILQIPKIKFIAECIMLITIYNVLCLNS